MVSLLFLCIAGAIVWAFYRLFKFWIVDPLTIHRGLWAQGIPGIYKPIVGEMGDIRTALANHKVFKLLDDWTNRFGEYFHCSFGPLPHLVISDPSLIQYVLKKNAHCYHKSKGMKMILGQLYGDKSSFMNESDAHSRLRRLSSPLFQQRNLNSMASSIEKITNDTINRWKSDIESNNGTLVLDIDNEMSKLTLNIVITCVFGAKIAASSNEDDNITNKLLKTFEQIENRISTMIGLIPIINELPLPSKLQIERTRRDINATIQHIIMNRKRNTNKSLSNGPDLLDILITASTDGNTRQLTDEEVIDEALAFVIAGHETTSTLMTWTFFNLYNNPDVYDQCLAEIDSVIRDDEDIDASTLSLLNYSEAVLKETLRLNQPVPSLFRTAIEDNTIITTDGKPILVKKGTDVAINVHTFHHSEKYWPEPFKFNPSRFMEANPYAQLAFSTGPRSCVGQNFAMLESKIMLALILKNFRLEVVPGQNHTTRYLLTAKPNTGMWMRITPR